MGSSDIRAFRKLLRQFERQLSLQGASCCIGVTLAQCHALLDIEESEKTTTGQIANNLELDKSTLSRTVDNLVKRGLVERQANPDDRRYTLLSLSSAGQKNCSRINSEADEFYESVFDKLPKEKREDVIRHFELLVDAVQETYRNTNDDTECCE